jgi:hypothetical protein
LAHLFTLIAFVWLWEACGTWSILSLYRMEDDPNVLSFLSQLDGTLFLAGTILFACTSFIVIWKYVAFQENGIRPLRFIVKWNILPLILIIALAEIALHVFSSDTSSGPMLGERALGPRRFHVTVHDPQILEYLSYDQSLGWTVRPNLSTSDHLYLTSIEGIRSSQSGNMLASPRATCRVALVGDSHTFGEEMKFEDTWGYHLGADLLKGCQVLNFGVPGYSVGQMYLRYLREVRRWHPNVIIFALSSHTSARTAGVYGLNMFSHSIIPWAQPRFQLQDHELIPINVPLPRLEEIATTTSISALPFVDHDWYFAPGRWELPRWRYLYNSYLFRLYTTCFPLNRIEGNADSEEAINHELLRSFVRTSKSDGSLPLVLYLPDQFDYKEPVRKDTPSLKVLRTSGVDYVDLRSCLNMVDANDRFIAQGSHYSQNGSIAIARCVTARLPQRPWKKHSHSL